MAERTISFVATGKLADWIDEQAEKRMTSRSAAIQQILAEVASQDIENQTGEGGQDGGDHGGTAADEGGTADEGPTEPLDEMTEYEFPSRSAAKGFRTEFSEYLDERDDRRRAIVRLREGTPPSTIKEAQRRSEG